MLKWPHIDRLRYSGFDIQSSKRYRERKDYDVERLLSRPVIIEEKLDGGFRGFKWQNGLPRARAKSRQLTDLDNRDKRHFMIYDWAYAHSEILENIPEGHTLCGEYLLARHHICYSALPCYFIGFSIIDSRDMFLSPHKKAAAFESWSIAKPPVIFEGRIGYEEIPGLVQDRISSFGSEVNEGCIIKSAEKEEYRQSKKDATFTTMFKFVRREFTDDLEEGDHWTREPLQINRIAPDGCGICKELERRAQNFEGKIIR